MVRDFCGLIQPSQRARWFPTLSEQPAHAMVMPTDLMRGRMAAWMASTEQPPAKSCAAAVRFYVLALRLQRPALQMAARSFIIAHATAVVADSANLSTLCQHQELVAELISCD